MGRKPRVFVPPKFDSCGRNSEDDGELAGVAALKVPTEEKRRGVFQGAGVALADGAHPFELGWVVVNAASRGRRLSRVLVESALRAAGGAEAYATSHDANTPMHGTLLRYAFTRAGSPFHSQRHGRNLVLFARPVRPAGASRAAGTWR